MKVTKSDIEKAIERSEELKKLLHKPYNIHMFHESFNLIFRITGDFDILAKVGHSGWCKYEFRILKTLSQEKYNVPRPIAYVRLEKGPDEDYGFGDLDREVGILFYPLLEGKNLKQEITKINIQKALNFLKKMHEDKSLSDGRFKDYQKIEVERGLGYIDKLFDGELAKHLQREIIKYQDYEINFCFIHGGPRMEHFIIKEDQMWMIDFEGACIGDPFKDLGILFTELMFYNVRKEDFITTYFKRDLSKEELARLKFFELRTLLVKMHFEPTPKVLGYIQEMVDYC